MSNEEKVRAIIGEDCKKENCLQCGGRYSAEKGGCAQYQKIMQMAQWKDEQLGWHDAKKEQPPMDEEVIVLTNILNGKELGTPRMICFGHIVDKNICVDYDGWNIPGVAYWMYYKEPK